MVEKLPPLQPVSLNKRPVSNIRGAKQEDYENERQSITAMSELISASEAANRVQMNQDMVSNAQNKGPKG